MRGGVWILCFFYVNVAVWAQVEQGELLGHWTNDTLMASEQHNNTYNEVWGLAINGTEYAIIGSTQGTHFVNVTDPENPVQDFFVQGASYGPHIIHRDYHDYKGYLYAVADEDTGPLKSTMQIIDISNLPESIEVVYDNDDRIRKAHNIFIDSTEARLYAFAVKGGDDPYAPLRIYDISNPLDPIQLGEYRFGLDGVTAGHYHDGFVRNNIAYLNAGFDGLVIADLNDPENPILLTHLEGSDYPESGYNHSGWLDSANQYYYMADETWGTDMKVFDVSDPRNVETIAQFDASNPSQFSIAHNQIVHCNHLYVSYYYDGLQVYNLEDPASPKRVLHYPTSQLEARQAYEGAWGVYPFLPSGNILVSDMQNGLFIIKSMDNDCSTLSALEPEVANIDLKVLPNPSKGLFRIESNQAIEYVNIHASNGQLLQQITGKGNFNQTIHLTKPGIYFAKIKTQDKIQVEKIIIQQ